MPNTNRTLDELLAEYASALRDGCIPMFLKSLTRKEAKLIASSQEFRDAAQMVRALNSVAFAGKAEIPNVSRFMSYVNAKIESRVKDKAPPRVVRGRKIQCEGKIEEKVDKSL